MHKYLFKSCTTLVSKKNSAKNITNGSFCFVPLFTCSLETAEAFNRNILAASCIYIFKFKRNVEQNALQHNMEFNLSLSKVN
jgi:hypothetical protein